MTTEDFCGYVGRNTRNNFTERSINDGRISEDGSISFAAGNFLESKVCGRVLTFYTVPFCGKKLTLKFVKIIWELKLSVQDWYLFHRKVRGEYRLCRSSHTRAVEALRLKLNLENCVSAWLGVSLKFQAED